MPLLRLLASLAKELISSASVSFSVTVRVRFHEVVPNSQGLRVWSGPSTRSLSATAWSEKAMVSSVRPVDWWVARLVGQQRDLLRQLPGHLAGRANRRAVGNNRTDGS